MSPRQLADWLFEPGLSEEFPSVNFWSSISKQSVSSADLYYMKSISNANTLGSKHPKGLCHWNLHTLYISQSKSWTKDSFFCWKFMVYSWFSYQKKKNPRLLRWSSFQPWVFLNWSSWYTWQESHPCLLAQLTSPVTSSVGKESKASSQLSMANMVCFFKPQWSSLCPYGTLEWQCVPCS